MLDNVAFGIVITLLFVSMLVLFCVLLVKLHINKIKNYTKVIYQKDLDFQKAINSTIIETQEQVLNNISQDLHDDAGQQLTFINFLIENYRLDHPDMEEVMEPLSKSAYNLSQSIRSISHSLNNQLLMQQDLMKAIEAEVERLRKNTRLTINFTSNGKGDKIFSTNEKIVIYRIFQECLNNILKHAQASVINITLEPLPFRLTIADDGIGFEYNPANSPTTSMGLQNIISRAEIIGYDVAIHSKPGSGTAVTLSQKE